MRCLRFSVLLLASMLAHFGAVAQAPRYWSDTWRGWHFYEEPEPEPIHRPPPVSSAAPAAASPSVKPPEIVEFERLQKALGRSDTSPS